MKSDPKVLICQLLGDQGPVKLYIIYVQVTYEQSFSVICNPYFWTVDASRFGILTLATMVLEADMNNHFPLHALNTWLKPLLQGKNKPLQGIFADISYPWYLLSGPDQVLDLHGAGIWELLGVDLNCDSRVLILAESVLCFISCLRHTNIQHFADFQHPTFGFIRVMTLYFSADVFLFTPFTLTHKFKNFFIFYLEIDVTPSGFIYIY